MSLPEVAAAVAYGAEGTGGYVGVCNVHSVITASRDDELRDALEKALLNTPDGMPLVWALRLLGYRCATRVYGQALMETLLASREVHRHYLVGSTDDVQQRLLTRLREEYPNAEVVGRWIPPFIGGVPALPDQILSAITKARPHVVWVGLGCPRQEKWMSRYWQQLAPAVLIGVGAAFEFLAGTRAQAPAWMRRSGLEWLFRLASEPRRLAWRYLSTNPVFIWRMAGQLLRESRKSSARF
jgi:N-acetylglucosaminyldiphosphoundecaprenol N-acetyl-beta-D-mannosaminyltransferase